ncbi:PepSY domain-containing protein [Pendulispora brunnea]|uniref:PepSY domain-containing protein n=1 Tax=Pendulispora brunnea TaxID=2905690 RepID=A0ABZ2K972_9BACT
MTLVSGSASQKASLQRWRLVHTWTSVVCTAFMLVLCITGLPLVFRDEIDAALQARPYAPQLAEPPEGMPVKPVDSIIAQGKSLYPAKHVQFVFWDPDRPHLIGLGVGEEFDSPLSKVQRVFFDDRTGQVLGSAPAEGGLTDFIWKLHKSLCTGIVGDLFLGIMSLAFLASIVSGVVVYGPMARRIGFGIVRKARAARIRWLDVHNLVGSTTLAWALVVGATGFINTLEAPFFGIWNQMTVPALLAPYKGKPLPATRSSVDDAVATARAALPDMTPTSVGFPESRFGSPRHYFIWMHGSSLLTARMFTPVLVEADTGKLATARRFPWYLRALEVSRPLHFGDYGGLPLKVLWALLDVLTIVVLGSGIYLWIARLRAMSEEPTE